MLQPKRTKHRKTQKGRIREVAKRGTTISFGSYALKALEPIWLTNRQIEAARQAMTRAMKREGNVWIRIFPDKSVTKKPQEVRMGKGKGNPEYFAAVIEPGIGRAAWREREEELVGVGTVKKKKVGVVVAVIR